MTFGADDDPPFVLTAFAGLQWVGLIMNLYIVLLLVVVRAGHVPQRTIAAMVALSMLALGAAALLQALPRGPIGSGYLAPSVLGANYLGPSILAIKLGGLPLMFGMTIFAGVCEAVASRLVGRLNKLFPTEIQGMVLFMIGVIVGGIGFRLAFAVGAPTPLGVAHLAVATLTFGTAVVLTIWARGSLRMLAILISMALGYIASAASGLLSSSDWAAFGPMRLFALPHVDHLRFSFSAALIVPFAIAACVSTAKTISLLAQCQKLSDADWREPEMGSLRRGVLADGLGTVISGLVGSLGVNTMPSAVTVPAVTGLASRKVAYAIAAIFGVMAFLPVISDALAAMPKAVMGGCALFTGSLVMINGLQTMTSCHLDQRRTVVLGLGLIAGFAAEKYPQLGAGLPVWLQAVTSSSLVFSALVAMIGNLLLVQLPLWTRRTIDHALRSEMRRGAKPMG